MEYAYIPLYPYTVPLHLSIFRSYAHNLSWKAYVLDWSATMVVSALMCTCVRVSKCKVPRTIGGDRWSRHGLVASVSPHAFVLLPPLPIPLPLLGGPQYLVHLAKVTCGRGPASFAARLACWSASVRSDTVSAEVQVWDHWSVLWSIIATALDVGPYPVWSSVAPCALSCDQA